MKHSVARKVTRRVSLLLLAAAVLLFIGAFHTVYSIVTKESRRYATALLGVYVDLLSDESAQKGIPIDPEHMDGVIRYGEYLCDWYNVDYTYVYIPDPETGNITYLAACYQDALAIKEPGGVWQNATATGNKTSQITVKSTLNKNGYMYRCVVTDQYGIIIPSKAAKLTVVAAPAITRNPSNATTSTGHWRPKTGY